MEVGKKFQRDIQCCAVDHGEDGELADVLSVPGMRPSGKREEVERFCRCIFAKCREMNAETVFKTCLFIPGRIGKNHSGKNEQKGLKYGFGVHFSTLCKYAPTITVDFLALGLVMEVPVGDWRNCVASSPCGRYIAAGLDLILWFCRVVAVKFCSA